MTIRVPRESVEFVRQEITSDTDPTGNPPDVALVDADTSPVSGDFQPGSWDTVTDTQPRFVARALVGPGSDFDFSGEDIYPLHKRLFVRVNGGAEAAIIPSEFVEVT